MRTLTELTRGIANIVDVLLGRMKRLEDEVVAQERRLSEVEGRTDPSLQSMELNEFERRSREETREGSLSDSELREELRIRYGATTWAKKLIAGILLRRRKNIRH